MGLWNFVKGSGKSLFGGKAEAAEAPKEDALKAEIEELGLDAKDVAVKVEGDKVQLTGKTLDAETMEKLILAVGNVAGVAEVEADETGVAADVVFYTVQKGDTLSAIAQKSLGKASLYPQIFEANKPMLSHPDKIYPGQVLRIPGGKAI